MSISPLDPGRAATGAALALVVAVAIWVRLQYITVLGGTGSYVEWALQNYFGGITPVYLWFARSLADGLGYYALPCATPEWTPRELFPLLDCDSYYVSPLTYPPGYAALLAGMLLLGAESISALRATQATLDAIGVLGVYWILRTAGAHRSPAFAGATIHAVYPLWAAGSTLLLAESLSPALMLGLMGALVLAARCDRAASWALTGLAIGVVALIRPDFFLFVGIGLAWIAVLVPMQRWRRAGVPLVAGFAVAAAGWGLHNRVVHDVWVFTSTGGGSGLFQGLGAVPNEHGYVTSDVKTRAILHARGLEWATPAADRFLKQEYLRAWREHPGHVLATIRERWKGILFTSEVLRPDTMPGLRTAFDRYGLLLTLVAMLVCRRNRLALLVLATPLVYALFSIGLVHWEPRYVRYVPLSYLFAAVLLASAGLAAVERRSKVGGVLLGSALLAAASVYSAQSLASLRWEAASADALARLGERRTRGELVPVPPPAWASTGIGTLEARDGGVHVVTGQQPFAYQATARLPAKAGATGYLVEFEVEIARGGATLGLLDPAGRWIEVRSRSEPGRLAGTVRGRAPSGGTLTLVMANHNPKGESAFTLRRLEILGEPAQDPPAGH